MVIIINHGILDKEYDSVAIKSVAVRDRQTAYDKWVRLGLDLDSLNKVLSVEARHMDKYNTGSIPKIL